MNKEHAGQALILSLKGELGHHEAIEMMAEIKGEMGQCREANAVLDLTGLTFMDSSGIAVVLKSYRYAQERGITFGVKAPEGHIKKILTAAGLEKIIQFI